MISPEELVKLALEARERAYTPYSGFAVGAALLCADGTVYQGCNIENAAFGPTVCAERVAVFKAVYDGKRDFAGLAVAGERPGRRSQACSRPAASAARCCVNFARWTSPSIWSRKTGRLRRTAWVNCCRSASPTPI